MTHTKVLKSATIISGGLLAILAFSGVKATAKEKGNYKILEDDPMKFKKLFVNLNLVQIDVASPTEWRPGIGAEYTLNRQLYFFGEYDHTIFSMATVDATNKSQTYIEAGTVYSFSSNIKERTAKIRGKSGTDHYKWKVKAKALKQYGVHAGLNSFSTYKNNKNYWAYGNTTSIFAGIAITTTRNIVADISDHDTYHSATRGMWYADVLIAPVISYADATDYAGYGGSSSTATPAMFPAMTKNPIGARMGYMKYTKYILPMREGFEFGLRPGVGNGVFFTLRADISLGFMEGDGDKKTDEKTDEK